jgi:peptidyl-prolyl cis-trans isomerase A (cyclophilin A)
MIQGGGFTADMKQKPTRAGIKLESQNGLKNDTGWVAMARTSVPDSASSQFFINVVDNAMLNHPQPDGHGYAVFGKVIKGMDTVEAIKGVRTTRTGMHSDVPAEAVVIQSMARVAAK